MNQATAHQDELTSDLIAHDDCQLMELGKQSSDNGKIPITLAELDLLNRYRLCLYPDISLTEQENMKAAESNLPRLVKDMGLDEQFLFMRRLQILSARMSIILSTSKDEIRKELQEKHAKDFEEVKKIRERSKDSPTTKTTETNTYGFSQKVWDNMSKAEKKRVKDREKAILALTSVGLNRKDAEISVDKHKGK